MTRDWSWMDKYYEELLGDIYHQPDEPGRIEITRQIVEIFIDTIGDISSILDVGSGEGYAQEFFRNKEYLGVTLMDGEVKRAEELQRTEILCDFNFLPFGRFEGEKTFDLILASHALEHSPFPLLTLMEWHRVSNKYLLLIMPSPEGYLYAGRNHYSVSDRGHIRWLLRRAGWKVISKNHTKTDLMYLCEKHPRISYEGWAEAPLSPELHAEEVNDP